MELRQLVKEVPYLLETKGDMSVEIAALCSNSREKTENGIFFCFAGAHFDAHQYAPQAVQNGCVALVVERFLDNVNVPQVLVSNGRAAMARICEAFFNHPERKMRFVGITGTKGKTTTSYMVKSICEQAGFKCGLVGTTGNMIGEKHIPSSKTTPDPIDLMRDLNEMVQAGVQVVVMEVSAHALDMHRLDGMTFECGCYTNLSQDHLDYFGTMENYFQCKKAFFTSGMAKNAAINADDERAAELLRDVTIPHMTYGIAAEADLFARDIEITENGVSFELRLRNAEYIQINLRMTGMFNVYNALSAAACALILGVSPENVRAGLESIRSVPGRIEMLPTNTPYRVILDYAHAPDALSNILRTCRTFTKKRLIALFGCGGDRDRTKRPVMAQIAAEGADLALFTSDNKRPIMGRIGGELADLCILTSDNPRTEDPMEILREIEEGIKETTGEYVVIENRRDAIRHALEIGREGDIIVLCGKGHETYQETMGVKRPFDEKVVVQELLTELRGE